MSDSGGPEKGQRPLKRARVKNRRRRKKSSPWNWRGRWLDALLVLSLAAGLFFLLLPAFHTTDATVTRQDESLIDQLIRLQLSVFLAVVFLAAAIVGGAFLFRYRINHRQSLWENHCPNCNQNELARARRKRRDRAIGWVGFPVRRYICRNCHWTGARIDHLRL